MRQFHLKLDKPIRDVSVEQLDGFEEQPDSQVDPDSASETDAGVSESSFLGGGLDARIAELELQLNEQNQAHEDLLEQLTQSQRTASELQTDRDSTRKRLEELETAESPEMDEEHLGQWQAKVDELGQAIDGLRAATKKLEAKHRAKSQDTQNAIVEIACLVAEKVVRAKIDRDEFSMIAFVDHIIQQISPVHPTEIFLHPDDLALLQQEADADSLAELNLQADSALSRGDCRVTGDDIEVEATLAEHIDEIRRQLANTDLRR